MKKVLIKESIEKTVSLSNVTTSKIYAGLSRYGRITVMAAKEYDMDSFSAIIFEDITSRNTYTACESDSLKGTISSFCINEGAEVFEFDNLKEFLEWSLDQLK